MTMLFLEFLATVDPSAAAPSTEGASWLETIRSGGPVTGLKFTHGGERLNTTEFSLYVMTVNKPAWHCYKTLGFHMEPYPHGDPHLPGLSHSWLPGAAGLVG